MISPNDVLRCMKDELAWALEGSAAKWGEPYLLWSVVPDWSELRTIRFESRDSVAVCVESEVFFEDTLDQVERQGWIQAIDPRYLGFRLIDRGTCVRKSVMLIRERSGALRPRPFRPAFHGALRHRCHTSPHTSGWHHIHKREENP